MPIYILLWVVMCFRTEPNSIYTGFIQPSLETVMLQSSKVSLSFFSRVAKDRELSGV